MIANKNQLLGLIALSSCPFLKESIALVASASGSCHRLKYTCSFGTDSLVFMQKSTSSWPLIFAISNLINPTDSSVGVKQLLIGL